jgi:hypothetical protein
MASTFSPNLRLELIGTGDQQGTWGATTNTNLGTLLEEAIGGYISVTVSDAGDTTLTANNGSTDQSRNMVINLIGTISAARTVLCPAVEKLYVVRNATTGGFAVTFKVSGQTGISIPNGSTVFVYVDGTDVRTITGTMASQASSNVTITGGSISGLTSISSTNASASNVFVTNAAGTTRETIFQTSNSNRFSTGLTGLDETGANAGSNFRISRYDDSGVMIDNPLSIVRSTGVVNLANTANAYTNTTQAATTAHVYSTVTTVQTNTQSGTAYTLALSDAGKMVILDNASAITLTVPPNSSVAIPIFTRVDIASYGAGQVTVSPAAGVTLYSAGSRRKLTSQFSGGTLLKVNTDVWMLFGDLS